MPLSPAAYLRRLIQAYLSVTIRPGDRVRRPGGRGRPDYVLLADELHFAPDILELLRRCRRDCEAGARLVMVYYSSLWRPLFRLADGLGLRRERRPMNWVAPEDLRNFLHLAGLELVSDEPRVLCPLPLPGLAWVMNRLLAPLPLFRWACLLHVAVAAAPRPALRRPSVSVVIPVRNERGNLMQALRRLPPMGPADEVIFVEGHSTDGTWEALRRLPKRWRGRRVRVLRQGGAGKGDAVRAGFAAARRELLMILDGDLTVPPEDLPKFYQALAEGRGELVNGSRLVYPMEDRAMRFLNMVGNKAFALAFSFVLGQRFKDTLCGTKALRRSDYLRLARHRAYFGGLDPFGDFDLLFGAARLGLRIAELPVRYRARSYGATNIQRWRHGWLLLRMLALAAGRLKFV